MAAQTAVALCVRAVLAFAAYVKRRTAAAVSQAVFAIVFEVGSFCVDKLSATIAISLANPVAVEHRVAVALSGAVLIRRVERAVRVRPTNKVRTC